MIEAIQAHQRSRSHMARCTCDECETAVIEVPAAHGHHQGNKPGGGYRMTIANPGQVFLKLHGMGWTNVRNKLRCPACEAARHKRADKPSPKQKDPTPMTTTSPVKPAPAASPSATVTDLRQPTREQRRPIMEMLTVTYDTKASRYSGSDTDKTIAEAIGGGIMPGWVSEIRDEFFGPSGENDEMGEVLAAITTWQAEADKLASRLSRVFADARDLQAKMDAAVGQVAALAKRVDAIKAAVGPKAGRC